MANLSRLRHPHRKCDRQVIVNQFSRSRVERGDFGPSLAKFGEDQVPRGAALAGLMGGIVFAVDGYDNDPR